MNPNAKPCHVVGSPYNQPAPCPPDSQYTELQCDLNETRDLIERLNARLAPVLMPSAPSQQGEGIALPACELKSQILVCNDRLHEILRRLQV